MTRPQLKKEDTDRMEETQIHTFRPAGWDDLEAIARLLADDPLGAARENPSGAMAAYEDAFRHIEADPNNTVFVAETAGEVVGCLQLTVIPGLSRGGMTRAQIESVRVAASARGQGLGRRFFEWAIAESRARGAGLVQLTTDKARPGAFRFYESLGFVASHEGMKLALS